MNANKQNETALHNQHATLQAHDLTRSYQSDGNPRQEVFAHLDLSVDSGESLAVIGRSGCGKTTLLRALTLLDTPLPGDGGEILYNGQPVSKRSRTAQRAYRRSVQYVPQDPGTSLDPRRTVLQQVHVPLRALKLAPKSQWDELSAQALQAVGIGEKLWQHKSHEISGGQAQRVAIARALVVKPQFLLLDEPVSGLDPALRRQTLELLADITPSVDGTQSASGSPRTALVLVSHDLAAAAHVCSRCVVMKQGQIVEDAPMPELLNAPKHPESKTLREAIPSLSV